MHIKLRAGPLNTGGKTGLSQGGIFGFVFSRLWRSDKLINITALDIYPYFCLETFPRAGEIERMVTELKGLVGGARDTEKNNGNKQRRIGSLGFKKFCICKGNG